ncbi:hypothetical protein [Bacillus methanolicus]|uniref:Putative secreted protein n=1 Tax=Bacillus methanolicus (strain MGA3 / ATCC 53907) TaxID=796606 RepID=I3EBA0_BACMM|nr:hypothetical protein [Bacillus methanolicus]AIE61452.1 putative secreted protein [Bacillus methanolicus MGA3]EIJ83771.1 hypothetical protein MGA3_00680 [Bacillus methanolicus MGA3]
MKKILTAVLAAIISLNVFYPSIIAKADIPTYYPVPEPKGGWKVSQTLKYQTINTKDAKTFAAGVAGYFAGKIKGTGTAALASGLTALWSSKIKGKTAYITATCYYKENAYIRRNKVVYTLYSDKARKHKIKSYTRESYFIKKVKR